MSKPFALSLVIFRRDLRLVDHTALAAALQQSQNVIPCFIFDPRQVEHSPYRGLPGLQFMLESLEDLERQLLARQGRLYQFWGEANEVVERLLGQLPIQAVFVNRDYTPFSLSRDAEIGHICRNRGTTFSVHADALLQEPEAVLKSDGRPYTIFTPYFRRSTQLLVREPSPLPRGRFFVEPIPEETRSPCSRILPQRSTHLFSTGGRSSGLKLLAGVRKFSDYAETRNRPDLCGTTGLSAHLKFGTISVREFYREVAKHFGEKHQLLTEVHWRDFFTHIGFHFPHVFGNAFHARYAGLSWRDDPKAFERWCTGDTGFPIVDAAMRQLNTTGWMHNRARMIVASFLTKDLHIDWRLGERYFATRLIDYDPSVNNGNWQWAASVGCDATPYFRVFNPWSQQKKFDPEANYIKHWLPELRQLQPGEIHALETGAGTRPPGYPRPMVDHSLEAEVAKDMFRTLRNA